MSPALEPYRQRRAALTKSRHSGIAYTMTAIDTDVAAVQRMFDVNLLGPMRMVHHFHDMLIRSEGTIVNIGSIGGVIPYLYGGKFTWCADIQVLLDYLWQLTSTISIVQRHEGRTCSLVQHSTY